MGMMVYCDGRPIWSPSERPGRLFLDETRSLEIVFALPSGVREPVEGTIEIDAGTLARFIDGALRQLATTNNGPLVAMAAGWLEVAIALSAEITGRWPEAPDRLRPIVDRARNVLGPLPKDPAPA